LLLWTALNENWILFPEIVVGTVVYESDCKYNVADVKVNDVVNYTKELALIVSYWFKYNTKFEAIKGVYEAARPGSYDVKK
jgi:hypothetical protein